MQTLSMMTTIVLAMMTMKLDAVCYANNVNDDDCPRGDDEDEKFIISSLYLMHQ